MENTRYQTEDLIDFATTVLCSTGLAKDRSTIIAKALLESDLMGHTTHGLHLLLGYTDDLSSGQMSKEGNPIVLNDSGSAIAWHGNFLPGPYLMHQALQLGFDRIQDHPTFTLTIQQGHHIACLAAYLEKATQRDLMIILSSSDPRNKTVAPFGGLTGTHSPNPISYGIPTEGMPILFDSSTSTVANGVIVQKRRQGEDLDGEWMLGPDGTATASTEAYFAENPATVLPVGGMDLGFKGFGWGILIEALTNGLGGYGRRNNVKRWISSINLQLIDPAQFGGKDAFKGEMQHLVNACKASDTRPGFSEVRLPGERALKKKQEHLANGVWLHPGVLTVMQQCAEKYNVKMPVPIK
ncbi:MAG: Ldh family oxidoreductase [Saprospiraceae bacterium]|nr:Ldh family oxidoreductase [Saprospiraceae bacterium]